MAVDHRRDPGIVGREHEQTHLTMLIDSAGEGRGGLALVSGEAGIGKTSLVQDLIHQAIERGWLVLQGGCYDLTSTPPYGPWLELLDSATTGAGADNLLDRVQEIGDFRAGENQQRFFEGMLRFLQDTASQQPVVAVLEDLHWSDPDSLDLLRFVARRISTLPILTIVTYRDDELTRRDALYRLLPALVREARAERIRLGGLTGDALRELVNARYAFDHGAAGRLVEYLERTAEGNPLFIQELLRTLEERRIIQSQDGTSKLGALDDVPVPELVQQLIDLRVEVLDERVQEHLEIASVIGQTVPVDLWAQVASVESRDLFDAMEQGVATSILSVNNDGTAIHFTHALLREALYERIFPPRRRDWHRSIGEVLAAQSDPNPSTVANHFDRSGDPRAIDWLIIAGDEAARTTGNRTAVERYDRAVTLLNGVEDRLEDEGWLYHHLAKLHITRSPQESIHYAERSIQIAEEVSNPALRLGSLFARAEATFVLGASVSVLDDWLAEWNTIDDKDRQSLDLQLQRIDVSTATLLASIATYAAHAGSYEKAREILAGFGSRLDELDTTTRHVVLTALTYTEAAMGRPDQAREFSRQRRYTAPTWMQAFNSSQELQNITLAYYADDTEDREAVVNEATRQFERSFERGSVDPTATVARLLIHDLFTRGQWRAIRDLRDADQSKWRFPSIPSTAIFAALERYDGNCERAWAYVHQQFPAGVNSNRGTIWFDSLLPLQRLAGDLAMDELNLSLAREWIEANQRWLDETGRVQGRAENHLLWARYYDLTGDQARSRRHAEQALEHASDPRQPLALLAAHRFLGKLDVRSGALDQADDHLTRSLELAEACAALFEKALTLVEIARLRVAQQDVDAAREALSEARSICERLGAKPTLDVITELEEAAAGPVAGVAGNAYGLSPREIEVLQLLVNGKTDREIAEELFISPRTAMSHVANIRNKLNVDSRTAAAGIAIREGLV